MELRRYALKFEIACLVALTTLSGCSRDSWQRSPGPDDVIGAVPWFATMRKGIAIKPYEMPLPPVEGTVPVTGVELPLPINRDNLRRIDTLPNPTERTSESLERGRDRFDIYCALCHGDAGRGDGSINSAMFNIIPSLVTDQARRYTDGYLYTMIRHGRGNMPAYGDKVRGVDRWHVVNYVRMLQGAAQQ
jgi:hypothetical protein